MRRNVKLKTSKAKWMRPELLVLTRSNPEEMVLAVCKGDLTTLSPSKKNAGCKQQGTPCEDILTS